MINIDGKDYKIIVGMATMNSRRYSIIKPLNSLLNQSLKPDKIIIYNNDLNEYNATDNAKFYYLDKTSNINEVVYYLTVDDDLIYPKDYILNMITAINKYNCIVTMHGRNLIEADSYYDSGHILFECTKEEKEDRLLDVLGTGVTGFRTDYYKPSFMFTEEDKRMSDLVLSLDICKKGLDIIGIKHKADIIPTRMDDENSCLRNEFNNPRQAQIASEIFKIKNK